MEDTVDQAPAATRTLADIVTAARNVLFTDAVIFECTR